MSRTKKAARRSLPSGPRTLGNQEERENLVAQRAKAAARVESDSSEGGGAKVPINSTKTGQQTNISEDGNEAAGAEPAALTTRTKRDHTEFEADAETRTTAPPAKKKYKSKAERKAANAKPADNAEIETGDDFDPDMAQMDPSLLADYVAKTIKKYYKKDTTIELEERYLPASTFTDTTGFKDPRKKDMLGSFLEFVVAGDRSQLTTPATETARPHTLVLCQAGIRAADLARVLRRYETAGNAVVKLFAKHFKIEQQTVFLRKNKTGFGVGTPQRVKELITTGGLKLHNLARIVIDGSYLDEKKLGIWGVPEVFKAMLEILKLDDIQGRIEVGDLKVAVY